MREFILCLVLLAVPLLLFGSLEFEDDHREKYSHEIENLFSGSFIFRLWRCRTGMGSWGLTCSISELSGCS
jgi:hypothetical protein